MKLTMYFPVLYFSIQIKTVNLFAAPEEEGEEEEEEEEEEEGEEEDML